ncbi:hypothetical protein AB0M43_00450 [Longispora sp. NPDC051575]
MRADAAHPVMDTGPWIFGHNVLPPAGVIDRVDPTDERCTSPTAAM